MPKPVASPEEFPASHFDNTVPGRAAYFDDDGGDMTVPSKAVQSPPVAQPSAPTMPVQAMRQPANIASAPTAPRSVPAPAHVPVQPHANSTISPGSIKRTGRSWPIIAGLGVLALIASSCMALVLGGIILFNSGILPGVSAGGVSLGGLSESEAVDEIAAAWETITLRDDERTWTIAAADIGVTIDADATAERAHAQGRGSGDLLTSLFGEVDVTPVMRIDGNVMRAGLEAIATQAEILPRDAGIELVNGVIRPTPSREGRLLDSVATVATLNSTGPDALADGVLDLVMLPIKPQVTDSTALVNAASAILTRDFVISAYDPIDGETKRWSLPPAAWAIWLTAEPDPSSATGIQLAADASAVRDLLVTQEATLANPRYLDIDMAVAAVQEAIRSNQTEATIRVFHADRVHVVQSGESIISIGWDYGVPYPWIQQANPGVGDAISVGQEIVIPSPDNFLDFKPIPNKRIVVSMSEQRTRVYEDGALKWDWPTSTGIADSPTWPGIYQIISHVPNAYASNWNLYMPSFMGVYRPVPGSDFTNGFHGFPTRGGSQLLWTNSLGTRVTYGCILLSNANVQLLWDWAEKGVVVEILP